MKEQAKPAPDNDREFVTSNSLNGDNTKLQQLIVCLIDNKIISQEKANTLQIPEDKADIYDVLAEEIDTNILAMAFSKLFEFPLYDGSNEVVEQSGVNWLVRDNVAYIVNPFDDGVKRNLTYMQARKEISFEQFGIIQLSQIPNEMDFNDLEFDDLESEDLFVRILDHARAVGTSDIHLDPTPRGVIVKMRVDGHLLPTKIRYSLKEHMGLANTIASKGEKNPGEYIKPISAQFLYTSNDGSRKVKVRVEYIPVKVGVNKFPKFALRLLGQTASLKELDNLNFSASHLNIFNQLVRRANGIVLVTGPTGSGKSTTLMAVLRRLHETSPHKAIFTVEDPVEQEYDAFNQIELDTAAGLTFPIALKSLMRLDPDVILVGEIRDQETAELAINAALTGHLVFATLHSNSAIEAIPRLLNMGVDPQTLGTALSAISAQRIVRKVCPKCSTEEPFFTGENKEERIRRYSELKYSPNDDETVLVTNEKGCSECKKGYTGRSIINEIVVVDEQITSMIEKNQPLSDFKQHLASTKFMPLWEDGMRLIKGKVSTLKEMEYHLAPRQSFGNKFSHGRETSEL